SGPAGPASAEQSHRRPAITTGATDNRTTVGIKPADSTATPVAAVAVQQPTRTAASGRRAGSAVPAATASA
uniref:hypothetical protein n=1 Tax=Mycobacterium kansasii TaxID=1768 RepID=UPI00195723AA